MNINHLLKGLWRFGDAREWKLLIWKKYNRQSKNNRARWGEL